MSEETPPPLRDETPPMTVTVSRVGGQVNVNHEDTDPELLKHHGENVALPKWRTVLKHVDGVEIGSVDMLDNGGAIIHPAPEMETPPFVVDEAYVTRHHPQPGEYFVRDCDGYISKLGGPEFKARFTRLTQDQE